MTKCTPTVQPHQLSPANSLLGTAVIEDTLGWVGLGSGQHNTCIVVGLQRAKVLGGMDGVKRGQVQTAEIPEAQHSHELTTECWQPFPLLLTA